MKRTTSGVHCGADPGHEPNYQTVEDEHDRVMDVHRMRGSVSTVEEATEG